MTDQYRMSFTSADLMLQESVKLAEAFLDYADWEMVHKLVMKENLLQARTQSSATRRFNELVPRLQGLSSEQLSFLPKGNLIEQRQLLWFAVCKRYDFIKEFAIEVLREKFLALDYTLTDRDFWSFFNEKADWHSELEQLSQLTKEKIRQVLFRMLLQAGLVNKDKALEPVILSEVMLHLLAPDAPMSYLIYPMPMPDKDQRYGG